MREGCRCETLLCAVNQLETMTRTAIHKKVGRVEHLVHTLSRAIVVVPSLMSAWEATTSRAMGRRPGNTLGTHSTTVPLIPSGLSPKTWAQFLKE